MFRLIKHAFAENQKKGSSSRSKSIKEGIYPSESTELAYFGSSVHYGARDFYAASSATNTSVNPINVSSVIDKKTTQEVLSLITDLLLLICSIIRLMGRMTRAIPTLLQEVNGGKVIHLSKVFI